jgi:hypothetical protein
MRIRASSTTTIAPACNASAASAIAEPLAQTTLTSQSEPQQRDPRTGGAPEGDDLAEIEIKRHNNPRVFCCTSKDTVIG